MLISSRYLRLFSLFILSILSACKQSEVKPVAPPVVPPEVSPVVQYTTQWQKMPGGQQGDWATSHVTLADGSLVIVGTTESNASGDVPDTKGGTDVWVIKLTKAGTMVWSKTYGSYGDENGLSIVATVDGGFIIGASAYGDLTSKYGIGPTHDGTDALLIKIDSEGNMIKSLTLGGNGNDFAGPMVQAPDGSVWMAGSTNSTDGDLTDISSWGDTDAWLVKLDVNLNLIQQKKYGGSNEDRFTCLTISSDGNLLLAASTKSTDGQIAGSHIVNDGSVDILSDLWVVKVDLNGGLIWKKDFGGSKADRPSSILQLSNGTILVSGETMSGDGDITGYHNHSDHGVSNTTDDGWVINLSSTGNLLWQHCLGGAGNDTFQSAVEVTNGTTLLLGLTDSLDGDVTGNHGQSDVWLVEIGADGKLSWQRCVGGSRADWPASITLSADKTVSISAYSDSNDGDTSGNHGYYDFWVLHLQ